MVRERADRSGGSVQYRRPASLSVAELRQLVSLMDKQRHRRDHHRARGRRPAPDAAQARACCARSDGHVCHSRCAGRLRRCSIPRPLLRLTTISRARLRFVRRWWASIRAVAKRGAQAAIEAGDVRVEEGQIIGAVEALNVLNEVESPATGRVRKILVDDGEPVEYGQALMLVEPGEA